jgi:hypothetical protein
MCGKREDVAEDFRWRPFCSRRCKMIDLGNWLDEVYRFSSPADRAILSQLMEPMAEEA